MSKRRRIFAKFVVDARDDADVWDLSDAAFRLWWSSILWCRDKGNDGYVPSNLIGGLSPVKKPAVATRELLEAGFWIPSPAGFVVRNYREYQDTAAVIEQRQLASRRANEAQGKGHVNGTDPVTGAVTDPVTESVPGNRRIR